MKKHSHVGNVTLILNGHLGGRNVSILLGLKRPKKKEDEKRKRKKVGSDFWVPPGGATEVKDKSQKHSAMREVFQETGLRYSLDAFKKVGILRGYFDSSRIPNWIVHIYLVTSSINSQSLKINEEYTDMRWFPLSKLPFQRMLLGDRKWLPRLVRGEKLSIRIFSNKEVGRLQSIEIQPVKFN